MNQDFQQCMAEAARLTRAGDLAAATALVQRALQGQAAAAGPVAGADTVIDVDSREVDERAATPPQPAALQPLARAAAPGAPALHTGRCGSGPSARAYQLYTPPQAAAGTPLPLVVMLHGCTQDAADFARGTGMNDLACRQGFHVLYPEQSRRANPQGCWNWFKPSQLQRGSGEVATLAAMVREAMELRTIDASRVYVAGLSAGGAMAAAFAAAYPDRVAAVGVHSGLAAGAARDLPSALGAMKGQAGSGVRVLRTPTIVFHGDADPTVHANNGAALFASVLPEVGDVRHEPLVCTNGRKATRHRRVAPDGRVLAEHWVLHGAGHAWSGGRAGASHTDPQGVSASAEMLRFFAAHRLEDDWR